MLGTRSRSQEAEELKEKLWIYGQRLVILLATLGAGILIGYQLWGEADELRHQVDDLRDRVIVREKERDTLKSQLALMDRDKKELEKRLQEALARCGIP
jgi:hypothetical protein